MLTGPNVILALKIAVSAVTVILLASLIALAAGKQRLHGRINIAFFVLTIIALVSLELIVRLIEPTVFDYFDADTRTRLSIHLSFALPSAALLPVMLYTGLKGKREVHLYLAGVFSVLWLATFVTGVFFLPH